MPYSLVTIDARPLRSPTNDRTPLLIGHFDNIIIATLRLHRAPHANTETHEDPVAKDDLASQVHDNTIKDTRGNE